MGKTYLIIGGTGFLGLNIVKKLSENKKNKIIVLGRRKKEEIKEVSNIIFYKVDIKKNGLSEKIFSENKIDIVINLYSNSLFRENLLEEEIIKEKIDFLKGLKIFLIKYKINKFIYFSSGGAIYGESNEIIKENSKINPKSIYGRTKHQAEEFIEREYKKNKINYLLIRPSNPYGTFQNIYGKQGLIAVILGKILKKEILEIYGNLEITKDYIYIDDFVYLFLELINKNIWNEIFNVSRGVGVSIREILQTVEKVTGKKIEIKINEFNEKDVNKNVLSNKKLLKVLSKKNYKFKPLEGGIKEFWNSIKNEK